MKKIFFSLLAAATMTMAYGDEAQNEARLLRFPATNGTDVVFTYAGDLYSAPLMGGEAKRLTSHVGSEFFARFSPDGKQIAFTGQYDGNTEVYLMPAQGGEPKRLTYTSTNGRDDLGDRMGPNNMTLTWTPDGKSVIFRNREGSSFAGQLWKVNIDGTLPERLPLPEGGFCSFSPDGKLMAYNRVMREFRTWKHYKGGMADDIWLYNPAKKTVENLTNNISQDIAPMWIGKEIFFMSDRDFTMNLFVYNTETKQTEKLTDYKDFDVKFPSHHGEWIVYEQGGYIFRMNAKTRKAEQIHITLNAENPQARTERRLVSDKTTSVSLSADGKLLAVTARGEVFTVPVKEGVTKNITRTPGANERGAVFSPDGKQIAYISDRTGETEIWLQNVEGGEPQQLTKDNDTYIRQLAWNPKGKTLLYSDRKNRLIELNTETKAKRTLMENPNGEFRGYQFSPDGQWITYTKGNSIGTSIVYLYNLSSGKEYPVTEKWYNSSSAQFSTDGKYLVFTSDRDINPIYSRTEWNHAVTDMSAVYMTMLAKDTPSPLLIGAEKAVKDEAKEEKPAPAAKGGNGKPAQVAKPEAKPMSVDPEGLADRIIKLPLDKGARPVYCTGEKLYFSAQGGVKAFDFATKESSMVAERARMTVAQNGKNVVWTKGRDLCVTAFPKGKADLSKTVKTDAMYAEIDYSEEWPQIFNEVWRAYRDGFYLENMHGLDWKGIRERYAQLLPYVKTRLDLNYVIGEMISEVSCGHAYVNPGEKPEPKRIPMGLLGADLEKDKSGFYRIKHILPDAVYSPELRSPLTEPGIEAKEGDYITAIDGISVKSVANIYELLVGKADMTVELTVNSKPQDGGHTVLIKAIGDESGLRHFEWVQNNIRRVEELSGGRVGYVYIPDMGVEGLTEFIRYFYPQLDKEALIVDDRANGGGNVSPMIIERLLREPYRMTMYRGRETNGTIPDATLYGPKVLLINKYSASDGDLFPWSWKANNLGTVIGTRTWGGIVGISGSLPYMDGTDVRVPFFTNYDAKTGEWIVENHGVDPDILLDNDPIAEFAGKDQQLEKAVEVILEQLKDRKPLPKTPQPRTLKDLGW